MPTDRVRKATLMHVGQNISLVEVILLLCKDCVRSTASLPRTVNALSIKLWISMKIKGDKLFGLGLCAFVYILFGLSSRSMANEEN